MSKIIESLRSDLAALMESGAIDQVTVREFDVFCPPPVREEVPVAPSDAIEDREKTSRVIPPSRFSKR